MTVALAALCTAFATPARAAHLETGLLDFTDAVAMFEGDAFPIEGSERFVRVRNAQGDLVVRSRVPERSRKLKRPLSPGRYVITRYQRDCNGTCELLGAAYNRCRGELTIRPGKRTRVRSAGPFGDCRMLVTPPR